MSERLEAVVSGRVQMVMYRDFVTRKARSLGLVGEVKNITNGTVRVVAEGESKALERLGVLLKRGSVFSRVDSVALARKPFTGEYQSFNISYD